VKQYKVVTYESFLVSKDSKNMTEMLNSYAKDGWRVVSTVKLSGINDIVIILEKDA
jgi:plasmid replication initiation protein